MAGWTVLGNIVVGDCARGAGGPFTSFVHPLRENRARRAARQKAAELLDVFGLTRLAGARVDGLPHATRRRIEIVRALLPDPRLLLLDEPAAGLGIEESLPLFETLLVWGAARGMTVLLVEHAMDLVMRVAGHVVALDSGAVIADGTPDEVHADPEVTRAYLGG